MPGRELPPTSRFAGDDGSCDAALGLALARDDPGEREVAVVDALRTARVLVPVVARRADGDREAAADHDDGATAAIVTVAGRDGRAVLPVFSGTAAMHRWDALARPVPVEGPRAALAAAAEADGQLVLDPAGPVTVLLGRPAVAAVAQGRRWVPALADADVHREVAQALRSVPGVLGAHGERGRGAELAVVLQVRPGLGRAEVDELIERAGHALAARQVLVERVDSFELRLVAAAGG